MKQPHHEPNPENMDALVRRSAILYLAVREVYDLACKDDALRSSRLIHEWQVMIEHLRVAIELCKI